MGTSWGFPRSPSPWVWADQCGFCQALVYAVGEQFVLGYKGGIQREQQDIALMGVKTLHHLLTVWTSG